LTVEAKIEPGLILVSNGRNDKRILSTKHQRRLPALPDDQKACAEEILEKVSRQYRQAGGLLNAQSGQGQDVAEFTVRPSLHSSHLS
jgi:hypothetical protein